MKSKSVALGVLAISLCAGQAALAQKSKDTLRAVSSQPISLVDRLQDAQPATTIMARAIFDALVQYDPIGRKFKPQLAKSWKQLGPDTIEFTLRDDVKFHDGEPFDADDVVYLVNYILDPKVMFRGKETGFGWIKEIQKLDKYTIRIVANAPFAPMMSRINFAIYPEHVHKKNPKDFGKTPVGTGPYRATNVDRNTGLSMVKNAAYDMNGPGRPEAKIGKIEFLPAMDVQTQVARMMRGEQDIMTSVPADQANNLAANPMFKVTIEDTISFALIQMDVTARSGLEPFKDIRVRRALAHAIDRPAIQAALLPKGASHIPVPGGMCHKWVTGCDYSVPFPEYDPAKAKKLLAEAGYPDGFEMRLTSWGPNKPLAELVSGELHKVGIRASVEHLIYSVYAKKARDGENQAMVTWWDNASNNDVDITTTYWFSSDNGNRDYTLDTSLHAATEEGRRIFDPAKRQAHYKKMFNKVNEQIYMVPLVALPAVTVHHKDLVVHGGHKEQLVFEYLEWAK